VWPCFVYLCVLYYSMLTCYFSKKNMCLDVDFVLELNMHECCLVYECMILKTLTFLGENELNESLSWKKCDFSHTKGRGSWQTCEINFAISSITIYNIWCLLWYLLHWNYNLTYHILLRFLFYVVNPNKLLQSTLVKVRPYGEQLH
jgi:hypothetical protein